jgi:hypothetical protein
MGRYVWTPESLERWRESMRLRRERGPIDKSKCGLPRNKPSDVWKYVSKGLEDECWNWTAGKQGTYGAFRIEGKYYKAHRVVYAIARGHIALEGPLSQYDKTHVLHTCDNPLCCNPKHLYLGDIWDNMRDKVMRNRQARTGPKKRVSRR